MGCGSGWFDIGCTAISNNASFGNRNANATLTTSATTPTLHHLGRTTQFSRRVRGSRRLRHSWRLRRVRHFRRRKPLNGIGASGTPPSPPKDFRSHAPQAPRSPQPFQAFQAPSPKHPHGPMHVRHLAPQTLALKHPKHIGHPCPRSSTPGAQGGAATRKPRSRRLCG